MDRETTKKLVWAAVNRRSVELVDGRVGQLVYFPGKTAGRKKSKLRHGDPTKAGVRFPEGPRDAIHAVEPTDIIGIMETA